MPTDGEDRKQRLKLQRDFYTEEYSKLQAVIRNEERLIDKFAKLVPSSLLVIQSVLLHLNRIFNDLEGELIHQLPPVFRKVSEDFDKLFLNYAAIIRLRDDIQRNTNLDEKQDQMQRFHENLTDMQRSQPILINNLVDIINVQFNEYINHGFSEFSDHFQNFIKLVDTFHYKLAEFHPFLDGALNQTGSHFDNLEQFASHTQEVEEQLSEFKKGIFLQGEPVLEQIIREFDVFLTNLLQSEGSIHLEAQFDQLATLQARFETDLQNHISHEFSRHGEQLEQSLARLTQYCQEQLDVYQKITPTPNPDYPGHLDKIQEKIAQLTEKIDQISKSN
jgi:predicted transcriptional regulator